MRYRYCRMMEDVKDARAMYMVTRREPFAGATDEVGDLKVVEFKVDNVHRAYKYIKIKMKTLHQALALYSFLWKKWVTTGQPFDRYCIIKDDKQYYVEVYLAPVGISKLRVGLKAIKS